MRRKTFDGILTVLGALITVILVGAGSLLLWGANYTNTEVHNQLASQKIYFPAANSSEIKALPKADATLMKQYAGQLMTTGAQAEVWADHFIAVHLHEIGLTYDQASTLARSNPTNAKYAALESTVFQGTTLRSELLEAYGFSVFGTIAWISSLVAFSLAVVFFLLTVLGIAHWRKVSPTAEI